MAILGFLSNRPSNDCCPILNHKDKLFTIRTELSRLNSDEPYRQIFLAIDNIIRFNSNERSDLLELSISKLTLNAFIAAMQLKQQAKTKTVEGKKLNQLIDILKSDPKNYTYLVISKLLKQTSLSQLKGYLENVINSKLDSKRGYFYLIDLALQNSPDKECLMKNINLLTSIVKSKSFYLLYYMQGSILKVLSINEKQDIPKLLKSLRDLSKKAFLDNDYVATLNHIIDELAGQARVNALKIFAKYNVDHQYSFNKTTLHYLLNSKKDKLEAFFGLLHSIGEPSANSASHKIMIDIANNQSLSSDVSKIPAIRGLGSINFFNDQLHGMYINAIKAKPETLVDLLDPSSEKTKKNLINLVSILIHSFKASEVTLLSEVISFAYSKSETRFLSTILINKIFDSHKDTTGILHFANAVENIFSQMKQGSLNQLENSIKRHGSKVLDSFLNLSNKYFDAKSLKIFCFDEITQFMESQDFTKIEQLFFLLRCKPILSPGQQKLLIALIQKQEELNPEFFSNMINNIEYLACSESLLAKMSDQMKLGNLESTLENIRSLDGLSVSRFSDLAFCLFITQSGIELENNCKKLSRLADIDNIVNFERIFIRDILNANENRRLQIDFEELSKSRGSSVRKSYYRMAATNHQFSDSEIRAIASMESKVQSLIFDLIKEGDINTLIQAYRESDFKNDVFLFMKHTELYKKYIESHHFKAVLEEGLKELIKVGAFSSVIESFLKKAITCNPNRLSKLSTELCFQAAIANITLGTNNDFPEVKKALESDRSSIFNKADLRSSLRDSQIEADRRKQSYTVYGGVYDMHHGFGSLGFESRRINGADTREDSALLRFARDIGNGKNRVKHLNSSKHNKFPGKGFMIEGLNLPAMFGFPRDLSDEVFDTWIKFKESFAQNLPWLAKDIDDLPETQYMFLRGMMIVSPPKFDKYELPGEYGPEHYSLVVYNDHFESDANAVAYLVPTSIIEERLSQSIIDSDDFTGFDSRKPDLCNTSLKFEDLNSLAKSKNLNILNLGWVSNLTDMANAYPVNSKPYFSWEQEYSEPRNVDFIGHSYRYLIENSSEKSQLNFAHKEVYDVSSSLINLVRGFQLALALRHKGLSSYENQIADIDTIQQVNESNIMSNPDSKYMLYEAYKWHHGLHSQVTIPEKNQFPVLAITGTFNWALAPEQQIYLDTYDMTVHQRELNQPEKIIQFSKIPQEKEEMYWNDLFLEPVINNTDKDLRLVDRSTMNLTA